MPRKTYRRKTATRRPRRWNRKRPIVRRRPKIYNFKRTCELQNIQTQSGIAPQLFSYQFKLSDLVNNNEFSNLFDQYRIKGVRLTFYPTMNVSYSAVAPLCEFYTVLDYDDASIPGSLNDVLQYQTLRRSYFNRPHKRYLKPLAVQSGVYQSTGVTTGYRSLPSSTWFDIAYPDIVYYGVKGGLTCSDSTLMPKMSIRVTATYYFQVRMVR